MPSSQNTGDCGHLERRYISDSSPHEATRDTSTTFFIKLAKNAGAESAAWLPKHPCTGKSQKQTLLGTLAVQGVVAEIQPLRKLQVYPESEDNHGMESEARTGAVRPPD